MKIISNYKEYYDYLQGIYGIDEKIVYARVCESAYWSKGEFKKVPLIKPEHIEFPQSDRIREYVLSVCGYDYPVTIFRGDYCFTIEDLTKLYDRIKKDNINVYPSDFAELERKIQLFRKYPHWRDRYVNVWREEIKESEINDKYNCPVVLSNGYEVVKNVRLSDFGINKILDPETIYRKICDFLTREPIIVDNRTNAQKVESHGFDKITSFRNM